MAITRSQYLQLHGLKSLAARHNRCLKEILDAAAEITGESAPLAGGHTDEMVYGDSEVDDMLARLEITVEG